MLAFYCLLLASAVMIPLPPIDEFVVVAVFDVLVAVAAFVWVEDVTCWLTNNNNDSFS